MDEALAVIATPKYREIRIIEEGSDAGVCSERDVLLKADM